MQNFNFIWRIWCFYGYHLTCLMLPFQAIIDDRQVLENLRNRKYRYQHLFPLILNGTILLDSLVVYLTVGNTPETPVFFFHVMAPHMPPFHRGRMNFGFPSVMALSVISNLILFLDRSPQLEFILFHNQKGLTIPGNVDETVQLSMPYRKRHLQDINDDLAKKLVRLNQLFKKLIRIQTKIQTIQLNLAFTTPFLIIEIIKIVNSNYEYFPSLRTIWTLIVCPLHMRTLVTTVHVGIQFMYQNYIIQTKQKHYLSTMTSGFVTNIQFAYSRFFRTMAQILDITREINTFNRFYTIHVTFSIIVFGLSGCAAMNACLHAPVDAPIVFTIVWLFYSITFLLFTFLFSTFSSRTLNFNIKLFKKLRQSQMSLLSKPELNPCQIIKLDLVNEYKLLLQKCSFKMANSSTINNKLFAFQIFGSVSVIYMKLIADSFW